MALAVEKILNVRCDIQRGRLVQGRIGGTKYTFDNPQIVASQVPFSIQSMKPSEVQMWSARNVTVSHKAYTTTNTNAALGDRIADTRYTPTRYYVVQFVEDMAGRGLMWGIFCNLEI